MKAFTRVLGAKLGIQVESFMAPRDSASTVSFKKTRFRFWRGVVQRECTVLFRLLQQHSESNVSSRGTVSLSENRQGHAKGSEKLHTVEVGEITVSKSLLLLSGSLSSWTVCLFVFSTHCA